jgi:hypothetical protein
MLKTGSVAPDFTYVDLDGTSRRQCKFLEANYLGEVKPADQLAKAFPERRRFAFDVSHV